MTTSPQNIVIFRQGDAPQYAGSATFAIGQGGSLVSAEVEMGARQMATTIVFCDPEDIRSEFSLPAGG